MKTNLYARVFPCPYTTKNLIEQRNDQNVVKLIRKLEREPNLKFGMHNNILYKLIGVQWKIVMPEQVIEGLAWACHETWRIRAHISTT